MRPFMYILLLPAMWALSPAFGQSSCSLDVNCQNCSSGGWRIQCTCNVSPPTIACCCVTPNGGPCSQTCGGCCRTFETQPGQTQKACQGMSCVSGVNCQDWQCSSIKETSKSEILLSSNSSSPTAPGVGTSRLAWRLGLVFSLVAQPSGEPWPKTIEVAPQPGPSALSLTEARALVAKGTELRAIRYRLKNTSSDLISAFQIAWRIQTKNAEETIITSTREMFLGRSDMSSGETLEVTEEFSVSAPSEITQLSAEVTYVENAEGKTEGRNMILKKTLDKSRVEAISVFQRLSSILGPQAPADTNTKERIQSLLSEAEFSKAPGCRDAQARIHYLLNRGDIARALDEIHHPRPLL